MPAVINKHNYYQHDLLVACMAVWKFSAVINVWELIFIVLVKDV